jgi:nucleoside-diphosphate-sugar epimerase
MRIVVTGASGNVGTALLRELVKSDVHELVGVARRPPRHGRIHEWVRWHALDLACPDAAGALRGIFDGADVVVHLAWAFQPTHDPRYLSRVGVEGTAAVLEAAHGARVKHLVHMSSAAAYASGRYGERVDESWPTRGLPSCAYSRNKSAAEALLDDYERKHGGSGVLIARVRPGAIVQRAAAGELMRYALPAYVPMRAVSLLPLLPLDRTLCIPLVHADDVADALIRVIERRADGPFNVAAEPPLRRDDVANVLGARRIHVPAQVLGTLVDLSWRARLQPFDRGWVDMAFSVPLLDCTRAHDELGWYPKWSATDAFADVIGGVAERAHGDSPPLRRRSMLAQLYRDVAEGGMTTRRLP